MKQFTTLLRREYWEERGAFLITPVVIGTLLVVLSLLGLATAAITVDRVNGEEFVLARIVEGVQGQSAAQLQVFWNTAMLGLSGLFSVVLFFVVFFYLLGSLYDDRKDRSILFWKSLPISDLQTVLSKLVAAAFIAPALMIAVLMATHLVFALIISALMLSGDLNPFTYLWGPAQPLKMWTLLITAYLVQALWMLPVWGWLLLCSAWAKSKPFLWAVVPPFVIAVAQSWINAATYLRWIWTDHSILLLLAERLLGGVVPLSVGSNIDVGDQGPQVRVGGLRAENGEIVEQYADLTFAMLAQRMGEPEMWLGVIVGVVFIGLAVLARRFRNET